MIIKELSKYIILDEILKEASHKEAYFLSHLLGNEKLKLPAEWPATIYTSQFICYVMCKSKPATATHVFKTLKPNVPMKFKSKDKTIMVTMFETGEVTGNLMFHFDDGNETYLYSGVFNEIGGLYRNEHFMRCVQKGIDNVYVDTTRSKGRSYNFTDDVVQEIKNIALSLPDRLLGIVMPTFGYEQILIELLQVFPNKVFCTRNQRGVLCKLGYKNLLGKRSDSTVLIFSPGITPDLIESCNFIKSLFKSQIAMIYLTEGKPLAKIGACGLYQLQWSPLPSLMDLQALLELVRPKNIVPINKGTMDENVVLPARLEWFIDKKKKDDEVCSIAASSDSHGSDADNNSISSLDSICGVPRESSINSGSSQGTTKVFVNTRRCSKEEKSHSLEEHNKSLDKATEKLQPKPIKTLDEGTSTLKSAQKTCDLAKKRTRTIRQRIDFDFADTDDDD